MKKKSISSYVLQKINRSLAIKKKSSKEKYGIHIVFECI